jgi:hypothetical protein
MNNCVIVCDGELYHHGIKGQKWGIRRYENDDGTLTEAGKKRYARAQYNASKYKTTGERLKSIAKTGLAGGAVGAAFMGGSAAQAGSIVSRKHDIGSSLLTGFSMDGVLGATAITAAMGAIGGMTVSALSQGYQAAKVKRGQNFVAKYKSAYEKTYRQSK